MQDKKNKKERERREKKENFEILSKNKSKIEKNVNYVKKINLPAYLRNLKF